ncbi:MAG TPA: sugar O-acetyltransferase [Candidatus Limnocylindrales bacterium]|nr:sugar O-acetyltransferase [Candidatus Limnocylindrales bacterium]
MLAGELYRAADPELSALRARCRDLLYAFNHSREAEKDLRRTLLQDLLGAGGDTVWIEPPFYFDYGGNIRLGQNVYMNFNCVVLDVTAVTIGSRTLFGPNVQLYTATHPVNAAERSGGAEFGRAITIGDDVWVGGSAVILPGVTIGSRTVIGAGAVVTKDLPDGVFAAGNPCRVLRPLE